MIVCTACGASNLDGSQFCDECGSPLKNVGQTVVEQKQTVLSNSQNLESVNLASTGIPLITEKQEVTPFQTQANSEIGQVPARVDAKLLIERGAGIGTEFSISSVESTIGRWDADNGIFPDIDLDVYDPEAKVSRRHARIIFEGGSFMIEDLGSTNGTFVNRGRRLIPGSPQKLSDKDEIIVGKTFLRFHIN